MVFKQLKPLNKMRIFNGPLKTQSDPKLIRRVFASYAHAFAGCGCLFEED